MHLLIPLGSIREPEVHLLPNWLMKVAAQVIQSQQVLCFDKRQGSLRATRKSSTTENFTKYSKTSRLLKLSKQRRYKALRQPVLSSNIYLYGYNLKSASSSSEHLTIFTVLKQSALKPTKTFAGKRIILQL